METTTERMLFTLNDFPKMYASPKSSSEVKFLGDTTDETVLINTMMISWGYCLREPNSPKVLEQYWYDVGISKKDFLIIEKMKEKLPPHFLEDLAIRMKELHSNRDKKAIDYQSSLERTRIQTEIEVFKAVESMPYPQTHKNLLIGMARHKVGAALDDFSGD